MFRYVFFKLQPIIIISHDGCKCLVCVITCIHNLVYTSKLNTSILITIGQYTCIPLAANNIVHDWCMHKCLVCVIIDMHACTIIMVSTCMYSPCRTMYWRGCETSEWPQHAWGSCGSVFWWSMGHSMRWQLESQWCYSCLQPAGDWTWYIKSCMHACNLLTCSVYACACMFIFITFAYAF